MASPIWALSWGSPAARYASRAEITIIARNTVDQSIIGAASQPPPRMPVAAKSSGTRFG